MVEYGNATREWLKTAQVGERKSKGQYMTPEQLSSPLVQLIKEVAPDLFTEEGRIVSPEGFDQPQGESSVVKVLDPAVGTGELLKAITVESFKESVTVEGWELDNRLIPYCEKNVPSAKIVEMNSLHYQDNVSDSLGMYDVVIGNPPFFEFKPTAEVKKNFKDVISGRVNIYALFFKVGLDMLKPGGVLGYIVPPSMNTGAYFSNLRNYILNNATVEVLKIFTEDDLFDEAQVVTQMIVLKKHSTKKVNTPQQGKHHYIYQTEGVKHRTAGDEEGFRKVFCCEDPTILQTYFTKEHTTTIHDSGFTVRTGTITWNNHKKDLTNTPKTSRAVRLIWSKNITTRHTLNLDAPVKYTHIEPERTLAPLTGPAIVVNRIVGAVGSPELKFAYIPEGEKFVAENHVNVITPNPEGGKVTTEELYKKLTNYDQGILKHLTGSTQLSATELAHLILLPS